MKASERGHLQNPARQKEDIFKIQQDKETQKQRQGSRKRRKRTEEEGGCGSEEEEEDMGICGSSTLEE